MQTKLTQALATAKTATTDFFYRVAPAPTSFVSKVAKSLTLMMVTVLITAVPVYANKGTAFITDAIGHLGTIVILIGAGLGIWGVVNLVEGYGNDNPGAKSQGMKQFMAGAGLVIIGIALPLMMAPLIGGGGTP